MKSCCDTIPNQGSNKQTKLLYFEIKLMLFLCITQTEEKSRDCKTDRKLEEMPHIDNILFIAPKHINM